MAGPSVPVRLAVASAFGALALAAAPVSASPISPDPPAFDWEVLDAGGDQTVFTVLDGVSAQVAWAATSYPPGEVVLTVDGATFAAVTPGDPDEWYLDVEAASADEAVLLASSPEDNRIYATSNGGVDWDVVFENALEAPILCLAMFDRRRGVAIGDPVDGKHQVLVTGDGGRSWERVAATGLPDALDGERVAGSQGDCATATGRTAFFATVGAEVTRVFRSSDLGRTWQVSALRPRERGVVALDFRTNKLGLAIGAERVTRTTDGGRTWRPARESPAELADIAWWSDLRGDEREVITDAQRTAFAVSVQRGSFFSRDRGKTWEPFAEYHPFSNVDCVEAEPACWASGFEGRVARLVVE